MTHIPDEAVQDMPQRIYAKVHGASTDVISGKRGLIGGWNEHRRDGQIEFVRFDIAADHLSAPCAVEADKEQIAKIIYSAMSSAVAGDPCKYKAPEWVDGGNIYMQGTARYLADRILSCVVTKPVDVAAVRRQAFEEAARVAETKPMRFAGQTEKTVREMITSAIRALSAESAHSGRKYKLGDRLTKTKGSKWTGRVVGFYRTKLTPIGYAIESETETGSVQIYPEAALTLAHSVDAGRADLAQEVESG